MRIVILSNNIWLRLLPYVCITFFSLRFSYTRTRFYSLIDIIHVDYGPGDFRCVGNFFPTWHCTKCSCEMCSYQLCIHFAYTSVTSVSYTVFIMFGILLENYFIVGRNSYRIFSNLCNQNCIDSLNSSLKNRVL